MKTEITGRQIADGTVTRDDLNTGVSGSAIIRKVLATAGITIQSYTGADSGTGDVTLAADLTFLNTKYFAKADNVGQNLVLAGPTSGAGPASFRALAAGDIPIPTWQQVLSTGSVTSVVPTISVGTNTTSADYLFLKPTDFGLGKPYLGIGKSSISGRWNFYTYDGTAYVGEIGFYTPSLKWNDETISTQPWVTTNFAAISHTHDAAGIVSGTLALARIPTGTTGTTVALGNHAHAGVYEPAFSVLPVSKGGSGAGSLIGYLKGNGTAAFSASATIPFTDIAGYTVPTWQQTLVANSVSTIAPTISVGTNTTSADYLVLKPTDYGANKPYLSIGKSSTAGRWGISMWDGTQYTGELGFTMPSLKWNEETIATRPWVQSQGYITGYTETDPTVPSYVKAISTGDIASWNGKEPAFSKNTAFNKNFGATAGTVAEGNDSRIINGQTAFSWGNHAAAGYLTSIPTWQQVLNAGSTATVLPIITRGTNTTSADYLQFRPSDYGVGKPQLSVGKSSTPSKWNIHLYDGSAYAGELAFYMPSLTWNDELLATRPWAQSQFIQNQSVSQQSADWSITGRGTASVLRAGNTSQGAVLVNNGGISGSGYIEFLQPNQARNGYIGYQAGRMYYYSDGGAHEFAGKVGIGTSGPSESLDVVGSVKQSAVTSAMLKADATGKIVPAVAGTDYLTTTNVTSGTYTPSYTAITGVTGAAASGTALWSRAGNIVTVSGLASVTFPTGTAGGGSFEISLPVASNLASGGDASGVGNGPANVFTGVFIQANASTDKAQFQFQRTGATGTVIMAYMFMYQVL